MKLLTILRQTIYTSLGILCCITAVQANNVVEVTLVDDLDGNLNGYCLDISGGGQNIDPAGGLQAHTCYSYRGPVESDQAVDLTLLQQGTIFLLEFDVCATLTGLEAGSRVALEACNGDELQTFSYTENGHISPLAAPNMCFTAGLETRLGRNGTSAHQIKDLTLEPCSSDRAAYQQWRTRSEDD